MLHVAEAPSEDMAAVTLEEGATMVVMVVVTPSTRTGANSHHASCVEGLITLCSNAIRDLIQIIWEKKDVQMLPTLMEWILIRMQIQGPRIM
jgi:hypothetical protein